MKRLALALALTLGAMLLLAACSSSSTKNASTVAPAASAAPPGGFAVALSTTTPGPAGTPEVAQATLTVAPAARAAPSPKPTASPSPTPRPDETQTAKAMLLAVNDFPAGWSETPSDSSTPSALDKCKLADSPGKTGQAQTGDFANGGNSGVSETIAIFGTAGQASASTNAFNQEADCVTKAVNDGKLDTDKGTFSMATSGAVSFPQIGDSTKAYRIKFHVKVKGQSGLGSEGDYYLDIVYVTSGRVAFSMAASDIFSPFDTNQLQQFTKQALTRVQQNAPVQ
jgi:hypothetical protein